jgi:hypothetical protein
MIIIKSAELVQIFKLTYLVILTIVIILFSLIIFLVAVNQPNADLIIKISFFSIIIILSGLVIGQAVFIMKAIKKDDEKTTKPS